MRYQSQTYRQYGAFALKRAYQKHMILGLASAVMILLIAATALLIFDQPTRELIIGGDAPVIISGEFNPPPTIIRDKSKQPVGPPKHTDPDKGGQLVPVDDYDDLIDSEPTDIASRSSAYEIDGGEGEGDPTSGNSPWGQVADFSSVVYIDSFVSVEKMPEAVTMVEPDYPRFAKLIGVEGEVIIKAFVDTLGNVLNAVAYRSSDNELLDRAAIEAAYKNKFTPGIQNGYPIGLWVTYKVEFRLDR